ncbi:hypothetical protein ACKKBF_B05855 [Auxenochlorella protothecoides x Auxenochlorella symbiontica]|uniref:Sm domain-containing protein n=1 Tax=Auxenochlorella protothecoides TaxID=3075 RepID=A0A1D2A6F0_AUXPR
MHGSSLNFASRHFDPLAALASDTCLPPVPSAQPLNNLYSYRRLLPTDHEDYLAPATVRSASNESEARVSRRSYQHQLALRSARHATHPLDAISNGVSGGPLLLLKGAMASGAPLLVVTRHAHGVRGRCTGRLAAFDKHLNLVLRDVSERYTVLMRGKRDGRTVRWQEARQRTLRQAFLHGSAVVSVSLHPQHASGV